MAKREDESLREKRDREEDEELEKKELEEELLKRQFVKHKVGSVEGTTDKLNELVQKAEPMIEQLTHLYNQFMAGAEKFPPIEKRKQLEEVMNRIHLMSKPTAAIQYRCQTLLAHFQANRDRWDRLIKDLESGKLKRSV